MSSTEESSTKSGGLRRRRPEYDDSNAWLVTYSDAITLILAFFVMILAVSELDEGKVEALKEGIAEVINEVSPPTPFTDIRDGLEQLIAVENLEEQMSVTLDSKGVKIEFANLALYESGSATIKAEAIPLLKEVSAVIQETSDKSHLVEVEGHTDDLPIHTMLFPSNWELSSIRATNIVRYLITQGIEKERLKASGFADSRPKEAPTTDEGVLIEQDINTRRASNRRVVIFVKRG